MSDRLWHRAAGERGPEVVLVHGAGASSLLWLRVLPALARTARVWAPDLPGHGKSEGAPARGIAQAREALRAFVLALRLERPVLVGHSMGGAVVLDYALAYPGETSGLVLCSTSAALNVAPEILELVEHRFSSFHRFFARVGFGPEASADPETAARDLLCAPQPVVLADFRACAIFDVRARLPDLRVPTLILCGDADRLTPLSHSQAMAAAIAGAVLEVVPGAGHMLPWEAPAPVAAAIGSFAARSRGPRAP